LSQISIFASPGKIRFLAVSIAGPEQPIIATTD